MNRLIVAWKRILHRKLYWCMLGVLLILTGIYALLPAKSQSTEIRVAVYLEDTSAYTTQFKEELDASASLYQFYYVDASTDVIRDVQAGDAVLSCQMDFSPATLQAPGNQRFPCMRQVQVHFPLPSARHSSIISSRLHPHRFWLTRSTMQRYLKS